LGSEGREVDCNDMRYEEMRYEEMKFEAVRGEEGTARVELVGGQLPRFDRSVYLSFHLG
jgi:hypothetical protein